MTPPLRPSGFAETALRVEDLARATAFYREVLGLPVFAAFETMVFLEVGPGAPGHPQVLALFEKDWPSTREGHAWVGLSATHSPLHHFALAVEAEALPAWEAKLETAGVSFNRRAFGWVGWRSLFFQDPDGNVVELVAVDPSARD